MFVLKLLRSASVAAMVCLSSTASHAQLPRATEIPDAVACTKCVLTVTTAATLSSTDPDGDISGLPLSVRRDARGRYWVVNDQEMPRVFAPDGTFLQSVGRSGAGPGEYKSPSDALPLPGDSILIIDRETMRASVIGPTFKYARQLSITMPLANSIVQSWPRSVVGFQVGGTGPDASIPLHVASYAGREMQLTRAFGPRIATADFKAMQLAYQVLALTPGGQILSAPQSAYRLYLWNATGTLVRAYARHPAWFADSTRTGLGSPSVIPPPSLAAVSTMNDSVALVFIKLPSPTWRNAWARIGQGRGDVSIKQIDFDMLYNTRVEALDLKHNTVLARADFPGMPISAIGANLIAMYQTGVDGVARLNIVRVGLATSR